MRPRKYTVFFTLCVLCLAFDAWVYGALAREPVVGPALVTSARASAPLLHSYIVVGAPITGYLGASTGQAIADAAYADAYPAITALPAAAAGLLFSQSHGPLRGILVVLYWAVPVLLALGLLAWLLRSRQANLMGRNRS
ncbi:MAG: hypothetical protein JSR56_09685 [Proteobacteria bacterium]|nr:hypothetical protein [Pseudomonadota bacterium]